MNQSNLKQVLSVVVRNILAKAQVEQNAAEKEYEKVGTATRERVEAARTKAVDAAWVKIKAAPISKSVTVKWNDRANYNHHYNQFNATLTAWASDMLMEANKIGEGEIAALNERSRTASVRFDYGSGKDDSVNVWVTNPRLPVYAALKSEFDALRISLLLSDDKSAAVAINAFLAKLGKL